MEDVYNTGEDSAQITDPPPRTIETFDLTSSDDVHIVREDGRRSPRWQKQVPGCGAKTRKIAQAVSGSGTNIMAGSTSGTSSSDVLRGHGIKDVIKLAVQSGAKECSDLFFTATKLFMNVDYREMFSALETNEGRLDWLNRMHEEMKKK